MSPSLSLPTGSQATTALVAGSAVAIAAYALASRSQAQQDVMLTNGKPSRKIPTPDTSLPLLGNLVDLVKHGEQMYDWMLLNSIRFDGEPWMFSVPGQPDTVMITKPDAIEEVTITQLDIFPKGDFLLDLMRDMFGEGLITSDGKRWYHQRKAASRFFSAKTLRALMMQSMQKNVFKMYGVIDSKCGDPVDLRQLFLEFTIETFAEMGLGVDLNCIGAAEPHPFQHALDTTTPIASQRFRMPGWLWKGQRALNVGQGAELTKQMTIVHTWLRETIDASLRKIASKPDEAKDNVKSVVELFIEYEQEDAEGVKPDDLVDFLLSFVIAARDTTANTLSWMMYELARHTEIEAKIREEMHNQLGNDKIAYLTTDHTKSLTYLEATIKETIRLYPGAPFTLRQAAKDTAICGDVIIRKGQVLGMCAYAMARNPVVWGPDADEFKPERWLDPVSGQILQIPSTKFFSFSAGPRSCIGMSMATLTLRIVAANMLYRYRFELDGANDGTYEVAPTMNMKHPLFARATRTNCE